MVCCHVERKELQDVVACQSAKTTTVYKQQSLFGEYETGRKTVQTFDVELPDGERLKITSAKGGRKAIDAGEHLRKEVMKEVLRVCRHRLSEGKAVRLGPYRVSPRGLELDGREVPWDDIDDVRLVNNEFRVRGPRRARLAPVPIGEVPHPGVFLALAEDFLPRGRRDDEDDDNPFAK